MEATALGNLLLQARALGHLGSLTQVRQLAGASFTQSEFLPRDRDAWEQAYARYLKLREPC